MAANLSELTAPARVVALVGLAKNTGKTVALARLLRELEALRRTVGVSSVGRDGEERDVINAEIEKPRVDLAGGSLVATTDALLRASGLPHELLERTDERTPLGVVVIARLGGAGAIEVAGPSTAAGVRAAAEAMLAHGAQQVLIDGAIDRRAASSPAVTDALVMSTGAVLSHELEEVVQITREAVELAQLARVPTDTAEGRALRELASEHALSGAVVTDSLQASPLAPRLILTADATQVAALLGAHPSARWLLVAGALPEAFLEHLAQACRSARRELTVLIGDATRAFLSRHPPSWYAAHGVTLRVLAPIHLAAITVNPLAPESHRFDSRELRALLAETIAEVPIFDVMHADYPGTAER